MAAQLPDPICPESAGIAEATCSTLTVRLYPPSIDVAGIGPCWLAVLVGSEPPASAPGATPGEAVIALLG